MLGEGGCGWGCFHGGYVEEFGSEAGGEGFEPPLGGGGVGVFWWGDSGDGGVVGGDVGGYVLGGGVQVPQGYVGAGDGVDHVAVVVGAAE